jgi:hypothetical protein
MGKSGINKEVIAKAVIKSINNLSPVKIETKLLKGYNPPAKIVYKSSEEGYIPDFLIFFEDATYIYEIELDDNYETDKWQLFSLYTTKNKGKFYLVVPDWMVVSVKATLKNKKINASILHFMDQEKH